MRGKKSDIFTWMKESNLINQAFEIMLQTTEDKIFIKNMDMVYVTASMSFVKMTGKKTLDEIVGKTDLEIFEDENLARRYAADDQKLLSSGENLKDYIEPIPEEEGAARYGITSKYILRNEWNEAIGILGVTRDVTREYFAHRHYQQELKYLFELPAKGYAASYVDVDSWRIINQRRQLIGDATIQAYHTVEVLCEKAVESIVDRRSKASRFFQRFTKEYLNEIYANGKTHLEFEYQRVLTDGSVRWVHNEIRFLTDVDNNHLCVMLFVEDIDAEKKKAQKLLEAAQMDRMTNLLNREATMEQIRQIFREEEKNTHVLFMIDVDNFKSLNDTMGHQMGDEFLIALTAEIKRCFGISDVVGRIGGDEFFALMRNIPDKFMAVKKAKELLEVIQSVCGKYKEVKLSGSIGVSLYPENGSRLEELYAKADHALYEAKRAGKNQFKFAEE